MKQQTLKLDISHAISLIKLQGTIQTSLALGLFLGLCFLIPSPWLTNLGEWINKGDGFQNENQVNYLTGLFAACGVIILSLVILSAIQRQPPLTSFVTYLIATCIICVFTASHGPLNIIIIIAMLCFDLRKLWDFKLLAWTRMTKSENRESKRIDYVLTKRKSNVFFTTLVSPFAFQKGFFFILVFSL